jgi:hypothetical protein
MRVEQVISHTLERERTHMRCKHLVGNRPQTVRENAAEKLAEADAVAKIAKLQATFSEARKALRKKLREDLDEEIAKMISEGGPTCWCGEGFQIAVGQGDRSRRPVSSQRQGY